MLLKYFMSHSLELNNYLDSYHRMCNLPYQPLSCRSESHLATRPKQVHISDCYITYWSRSEFFLRIFLRRRLLMYEMNHAK